METSRLLKIVKDQELATLGLINDSLGKALESAEERLRLLVDTLFPCNQELNPPVAGSEAEKLCYLLND